MCCPWQCRHERPGTAEESLIDQDDGHSRATRKDFLRSPFPNSEHIAGIFTKSCFVCSATIPLRRLFHRGKAIQDSKHPDTGLLRKTDWGDRWCDHQGCSDLYRDSSPAKEVLIKQKASILTTVGRSFCGRLLICWIEAMPKRRWRTILISWTSIRGIGEKFATNFLVELGGDPRVFPSHRQIIAMADWDPSLYQSGQYVGLSRYQTGKQTSQEGIIWLMTVRSSSLKDISAGYFERRIKNGRSTKRQSLPTAQITYKGNIRHATNKTLFNARWADDSWLETNTFQTCYNLCIVQLGISIAYSLITGHELRLSRIKKSKQFFIFTVAPYIVLLCDPCCCQLFFCVRYDTSRVSTLKRKIMKFYRLQILSQSLIR